ncbi:MAG: hypothetical protein VB858_12025 [Planctomycetaceae bacterium]
MIGFRTGFFWHVFGIVSVLLIRPAYAQPDPKEEAVRNASAGLQDILHEQSDLRRELQVLKQETHRIQQRLENLDQLAEVQTELDQLIQQLEQAESSDKEERAARLESRIELLERQRDHLREMMEKGAELDERIDRVQALVHRLNHIKGITEAARSARYLLKTVDSLHKVREIRDMLNMVDPDTTESVRNRLQQQVDGLQEQIDADDELVELTFRLLEALQDERDEDAEDLEPEIGELRRELENQRDVSRTKAASARQSRAHVAVNKKTTRPDAPLTGQSQLTSGKYFVTQSWSQEKAFRRPYYVNVPQHTGQQKHPVFIFLHGNGGNAQQAMQGFMRNRRKLAASFVMVFAQGYRESWNIVSERSKADDRIFIEEIVLKLATFDNVEPNNFSIMGASNGAALVNQLAIESRLSNIRNYISGVSPLNVWQYDGEHFKARGNDNRYRVVATPMAGKRLMNISGTDDELVPYRGGPSKHIPAKGGKLAFVDAEKSIYLWARQMGYEGEQLSRPSRIDGRLEMFSYLAGDVVHYKVSGAGHGATHEITEEILLGFLQGGRGIRSK